MHTTFDLGMNDIGIRGHLWDVEEPSATACLIHGVAGHAGRFERMAEIMNKAGIAVEAIDLPGHGLSEGVPGDCAPRDLLLACVSKLILWTSFRYPGIPLTLYGHSMGGGIVLEYRERGDLNDIPDKYIASAPWLLLVHKVPMSLYLTVRAAAAVSPKHVFTAEIEPERLGNIRFTGDYLNDPLAHPCLTARAALAGYETGLAILRGTLASNGRAYGRPLLLMHGTEDIMCDIEGSRVYAKLHAGEPGFNYIEWPGYMHEIHNGGREATGEEAIEKMCDFIKE